LFPQAQDVDRSTIPASHFAALADAGLFSIVDLPPSEARRVIATIGGSCGATFFVWVQHHGVVRTLASSSNHDLRATLDEPLRNGTIIAGTAFAHVRRVGRPAIRAERDHGAWRLNGFAPWATSWGIAERFCVAAETDDGQVLWSMLPGNGGPGVTAAPLELPVFAATGTVTLSLDDCPVGVDQVVALESADHWRAADRRRASIGQPAVLGVTERAIRLLGDAARDTADEAASAAGRLTDELGRLWERDDELVAALAAGDDVVEAASDHRARCLDLAHRSTTALLAAVGGAGMDLSHPAQRLAREAAFYVIQAQTVDGRAATLRSV